MKHQLAKAYFKIMNLFHTPFLQNSEKDPYHFIFQEFIDLSDTSDTASILEIGARNISGVTRRELFPHCTEYIGLDILEGGNVDVVGDAHKLSDYFPHNHFDFVYSISVFEHLLFPWKVILELNKVMKTGGYVYLSTHPSWPTHELPWDFWRFLQNGFHALFNKYTGFEIISIAEGLPGKLYSLSDAKPTRGICTQPTNLGVALIAKKIAPYNSEKLNWDIDIEDVVDTMYPAHSKKVK